ncbi:MAG: response regulator [Nostocaceae cyanobacterium]|nr:response regulator [Nostocaceae cyanobacterium]
MLPEQQQRILGYFIEEAKDHLNTIEQGLLNLPSTIKDQEMVAEVFRAAHSIKGGAAMLGLASIQRTSHRLEDCFKVLKECPIQVDQKLESLFLSVSDTLKELLEQLQGPFGLTEDAANNLMSEAEPVFVELNQHIQMLVQTAVGTVPGESAPLKVTKIPTAAQTQVPQPTNSWAEFDHQVMCSLREMLQLFKQAATPAGRTSLEEHCIKLVHLGEEYNLPNWSSLCQAALGAISNQNNNYLTLAKTLIKELKQAEELVLEGRDDEIDISSQLQALLSEKEQLDLPAIQTPLLRAGTNLPQEQLSPIAPPTTSDSRSAVAEHEVAPLEDTLPSPNLASVKDTTTPPAPIIFLPDDEEEAPPAFIMEDDKSGPEVGMAELNTLADLFEGEGTDLDDTWQHEELLEVGSTSSMDIDFIDSDNLDVDRDLADLLFDEVDEDFVTDRETDTTKSIGSANRGTTIEPTDSGEDLSLLFGENFLDEDSLPLEEEVAYATEKPQEDKKYANNLESRSQNGLTDLFTAVDDETTPLIGEVTEPKAETIPPQETLTSQEASLDELFLDTELDVEPAASINQGNQDSVIVPIAETEESLGLDDIFSWEAQSSQLLPDIYLGNSDLFNKTPSTNSQEKVAEVTPIEDDFSTFWQSELETTAAREADTTEQDSARALDESLFAAASEDIFTFQEEEPQPLLQMFSWDEEENLFAGWGEPTENSSSNLVGETLNQKQSAVDSTSEFTNQFNVTENTTTNNGTESDLFDSDGQLDTDFAKVSAEPVNFDALFEDVPPANTPEIPLDIINESLELGDIDESEDDLFTAQTPVFSEYRAEPTPAILSNSNDWNEDDLILSAFADSFELAEEDLQLEDGESNTLGNEQQFLLPDLEAELSTAESEQENLFGEQPQAPLVFADLGEELPSIESEQENLFGEQPQEQLLFPDLETELPSIESEQENLFGEQPQEQFLFPDLEAEQPSIEEPLVFADLGEELPSIESEQENLFGEQSDELLVFADLEAEFRQQDLVLDNTEVNLSQAFDSRLEEENLTTNENLEALFSLGAAENEASELALDLPLAEFTDETTEDFSDLFNDQPEQIETAQETPSAEQTEEQELSELDEFAELDDLLAQPTIPATSSTSESARESEFAELEALLEIDSQSEDSNIQNLTPATAIPAIGLAAAASMAIVSEKGNIKDEFDDLEKLLEEADKTMGGSPAVKKVTGKIPRSPSRRAPRENTMRVSVKHLDNLSNLVGELVVNRNTLEQDQEKLRQFLDNLLHQVQQLHDVGARMQELYERSLLEASLLASRQGTRGVWGADELLDHQSTATRMGLSHLELDRFTPFHTLSQEMIELIVRVRESASDIEFVTEDTERVARQFRQVTTQLQEGLTRARMVSFAQVTDRLQRGVRDNGIKYGKQVELTIEGRDTLIDKMILEHLTDPLTHMLNNAIAHGIEPPEIRQAAGKPPVGKVVIRAFHQGNQTVISVADDGAGIDPERIKAKAVKMGIVTPEEAKAMSRLDVYDLLFQSGFTIKDQADELSGRGVGMDVVRTTLSEIRGNINTDSAVGRGTTFTIRLPLTLSICKALCCLSERATIAFPMDGVEDTLEVSNKNIQVTPEGQAYIPWRDQLLPLRPLKELLAYNRQISRGIVYGGKREDDKISVVVIRSTNTLVGLQVDEVRSEQEIVIKQFEGPVPKPLGVAGATVLGDGRIMPIADVLELIDIFQGRMPKHSSAVLWDNPDTPITQEPPSAKVDPTVLIIDDSITVRELLSLTFNKAGYRVEQARDGQEAWDKLRSGLPCDIVFCDIEMPRCDGLELLSRIQKDSSLNQIPIAMLTSRGADRHRQMAVSLGASGYFTKPYLEEALLDAASRMLKGERMV